MTIRSANASIKRVYAKFIRKGTLEHPSCSLDDGTIFLLMHRPSKPEPGFELSARLLSFSLIWAEKAMRALWRIEKEARRRSGGELPFCKLGKHTHVQYVVVIVNQSKNLTRIKAWHKLTRPLWAENDSTTQLAVCKLDRVYIFQSFTWLAEFT